MYNADSQTKGLGLAKLRSCISAVSAAAVAAAAARAAMGAQLMKFRIDRLLLQVIVETAQFFR
jgi:hypothetical protein